jgi:multidrug efflux pump subunit AcrB
MARFFVNRPIVAMVISIITVIVGLVVHQRQRRHPDLEGVVRGGL